jgi:hypothetical protein
MPRILQEPAQLRHSERRLLRPARGAGDSRRVDRPSELRVRRKRRDQQLNPALKSEQRLPKLMRPVRAHSHRRPLLRRKLLPQTADEMLGDRQTRNTPDPQSPHLRRRDEHCLTRREDVGDDPTRTGADTDQMPC